MSEPPKAESIIVGQSRGGNELFSKILSSIAMITGVKLAIRARCRKVFQMYML